MPNYFIFFLAMLASSVLLYLTALGFVAAKRRPLPVWIGGAAASRLQGINVALMWSMFGVTWLLYFNVYRIHVDMSVLSNAALRAFSVGYTKRLPIVVLPYGMMCLLGVLALWSEPARISRRALWGIATLLILTILTTPFAAGAQGDMQEHGFTQQAYDQLQISHLMRSVLTTIAAVWGLAEGWKLRNAAATSPSTR